MLTSDPIYRKLSGAGLRQEGWVAAGRSFNSLWLADDHLLSVDTESGITERYKRFYFRDIQVILVRKTPAWLVTNLVLAGFTALFGLLMMFDPWNIAPVWVFFCLCFAVPLVISLARGPTCVCHLQTAVQTEELPSLNRLRRARKALAQLRPLIEAAQGAVTPEQFATWEETRTEPTASAVAASAPPVPMRHEHGRYHAALYCLLLFDAVNSLGFFFLRYPAHDVINGIVNLGEVALVVMALVKQHQSDLPRSLRAMTWFFLSIFLVIFSIAAIYGAVAVAQQGRENVSTGQMLESPFGVAMMMVSVGLSLGVGSCGLLLLHRFRRAVATAPPLPPEPPPAT